jgi:hypothetical protein
MEVHSPSLVNLQTTMTSCNDPTWCRTTWDIVLSCITTTGLSIWITMHPNVLYSNFESCLEGEDTDRKAMSIWRKIPLIVRRKWNNFTYRLPLFIIAIIYPEFIFAWALQQYFFCWDSAKRRGMSSLSHRGLTLYLLFHAHIESYLSYAFFVQPQMELTLTPYLQAGQ